jgi:prepilin-type N-terminal cleavage/methylation domain-containing protein
MKDQPRAYGFTLIELSIVLVIIGLAVGSVLVGQDLIRAGAVRSQIAQIDKFQTAVRTFQGKYEALPGDLNSMIAQKYGFAGHGPERGTGDGNGVLEGWNGNFDSWGTTIGPMGETAMFWSDLTYANGKNINLIEGTFNAATTDSIPSCLDTWGGLSCPPGLLLPEARIGRGNYVYVWSGGPGTGTNTDNSTNYFGVSALGGGLILTGTDGVNNPGLSVHEAYNIDKKLDDGLPQSGRVIAMGMVTTSGAGIVWAARGTVSGGPGDASATLPSSTLCFDNAGIAGATQRYSIKYNAGTLVTCTLSFQFQ